MMSDENNLITGVPASLSCYVLSEWLHLRCLGRLDSAFCNHAKRSRFLGLLRSDECICDYWLSVSGTRLIQWAIEREVKCTRISCSRGYDQERLRIYLQANERFVHTLRLPPLFGAVDSCRHLTHLECPLSEETCMLLTNNPNLQELTVTSGPSLTSSLNDAFCAQLDSIHLPMLTVLAVNVGGVDTNFGGAACLLSLVRIATCLTKFETTGSSHTIDSATWITIATLCSALQELFMGNSNIDGDAMVEFARLCPHITKLLISSADYMFDSHFSGMVQNAKQLRSLALQQCDNITDESLVSIGEECSALEELVLMYNNMLTRRVVKLLREKLPKLRVWFNSTITCIRPGGST